MSDNTHEEAHTGPIQTPKQLFWVSVAAFVVPVFIIIGLVYAVTSGNKTAPGASDAQRAIAERLQKVGTVALQVSAGNRPLASGEEVYKAQCSACHATGVSGAPKTGNAGEWSARITQGYDVLLNSALKGKNAMAPQGGGTFSDLEIGRAVVYLANAAGAKFEEPAAPAADGASQVPAAEQAQTAPAAAAPASEAPAVAVQPVASAETPAAASAPAETSAPAVAAAPAADPAIGKAIYDKACALCHAAGVAGAPKFGDKQAWAPRIATGLDTLVQVSIAGKGTMPPRGASTASDDELRAAVQYMVSNAQ